MEETKIIYHIDDEDTPYLIKLPIPSDRVTLGDFKNALNRPNYKFFFKSMDDDFGVVKEEIVDEESKLPCFNGRVVSWLVAAESSVSDTQSQCTESQAGDAPPTERVGGIGDSRPPSIHANPVIRQTSDMCDTCTETDSVISSRRDAPPMRPGYRDNRNHPQVQPHPNNRPHPAHPPPRINGHSKYMRHKSHGFDATSSMMSSDIDSTSFFDSEDDASSRFTSATETTRSSRYGQRKQRRRRHRLPPMSRASSFSSITDSTMSLNIITVTLNMDTVNFLGISIVGQSNKGGDGGIYVGSIMKGGAVAQDGRIEPGDMILEVNGISFENMSNDDAVRTLREAVQKPGSPITLVVAKCWDPNPKGYFTVPRQEPVRPIDPSAWVAHTEAMRGLYGGPPRPGQLGPPSLSTITSTTSSITSSIPDSERFDDLNLTINTDMATIVRAMAQPDSGLEIRDRMWLKITIPNAFIGSDLVDWLHTHVEGFADRRDARKYATNFLKGGYIRHTVNKLTFSEQCYYVFGDLCGVPELDYSSDLLSAGSQVLPPQLTNNLSSLTLEDIDSVSEAERERDRDRVGPLPPPAWSNQYSSNPYGPSYMPPPPPPVNMNYPPPAPFYDSASYVSVPMVNNSAGSIHSGSAKYDKTCACIVSHTYKQIRKLWENPDKVTGTQNGMKNAGKFADDMDRSTSSSTGMRAFKGLSVGQDVCVELCLPFWRCPIFNKTPKHLAQYSTPSGDKDVNFLFQERYIQKDVDCHKNIAMDGYHSSDDSSSFTGSSASGNSQKHKCKDGSRKSPAPCLSGSDTETGSVISARRLPPPPVDRSLPPPPGELANTNADLSGSRQSFRMAMGNPYNDETLHVMGDL